MKLPTLPLLLLALMTTAPASAEAPDINRARTGAPSDLAADTLQALGSYFVEVERPDRSQRALPGDKPYGLTFATRARAAGYPGLCQATVVWAEIDWPDEEDDYEPPARSYLAFKVVGDLEPQPGDWNPTYGEQLRAKCSQGGRVLRTEMHAFEEETFFTMGTEASDRDAWAAARVLQRALAAVPSQLTPLCEFGDDQGCVRTMAGLRLQALSSVSVGPCLYEAQLICVEGRFVKPRDAGPRGFWVLQVQAEVENYPVGNSVDDVTRIDVKSVSLQRQDIQSD